PGRNHMNKDFSQTPRPTFKRALRRISVISVVMHHATQNILDQIRWYAERSRLSSNMACFIGFDK
ncbi:hypothetical protein SM68_03230, partial [Klebsiella pneumoniae]